MDAPACEAADVVKVEQELIQQERRLMQAFLPPNWTPQEYLDRITDPRKRGVVGQWLDGLAHMLEEIKRTNDVQLEFLPEVRVRDTDQVGMEGNAYAIFVNRGHIDYCYALGSNVLECVDEHRLLNIETLSDFVGLLAFRWAVAHELFHGARAHNLRVASEAENHRHDSNSLARGAEHDADLSAAAYIFRNVQAALLGPHRTSAVAQRPTDLTNREVTLCVLFAALRELPDAPIDSAKHLTRAKRLISIQGKLAMVGVTRTDAVDQDLVLPETRARAGALINCLIRCEQQFQAIHGVGHGNLLLEILNESNNLDTSHIAAWGSMDATRISEHKMRFEMLFGEPKPQRDLL